MNGRASGGHQWLAVCLLCLCLAAGAEPGGPQAPQTSQDDQAQPAPSPQYTLHAYTNLIQIPVLVLSPERDRLSRPIPPGRFALSIDSGPWFRASHVRPEGDDPISLSILLDSRGDTANLLPHIDEAIGSLAPQFLHPGDHVTLFGLDCGLVRSGNELPANPLILREQVDAALEPWRQRIGAHQRCATTTRLQDSIVHIVTKMDASPGRRVLLVLTEGEEGTGKISWPHTAELAQTYGTVIFALTPRLAVQQVRGMRIPSMPSPERLNTLDSLCQASGGILLSTSAGEISSTLHDFIRIIRERYIVEFPRAANSTAGRHSFAVRIDKTAAFIRPAGIAVPLEDPELMNDPTTIRSNPALTPVQGDRPPRL